MTDNQAKKDRLVQEGVSKYDFEVAEAVVAVDTYFKESRPGESFGSFLLRDDWIDESKLEAAGDDDMDEAYLSVDNNLVAVTKEKLSLGSPDDFSSDDDDNDVYSSIEGEVRGLNKHGYPAVTAKSGKEAKVSCQKELHLEDQKVIQKHSAEKLLKAAETVAHEIDSGDFLDTEVVAGAFFKKVLHQAEKEFGILRHKFKKHHAAKVVAEFLRFAEDKQPGEAMLSGSRHYLGCLNRRGSPATNSFDRDDDDDIEDYETSFPNVGSFYDADEDDNDIVPSEVKIFSKKKKKDIEIVKDTDKEDFGKGEKKELPIAKRRTPLKDPVDGVLYKSIKYVRSYASLANHHSESQEDEIWISARNIAQWTEFAAAHKVRKQPQEKLGIFLMQAAYYCSSAVASIPEVMSNSSIMQGQANSQIKTMVYRSLIRRQTYSPGKLSHLNPSRGPNGYNPGFGVFDAVGFKEFDEAVFRKSEFHFFGAPRRGVKTLRQAELDLSGILQNSRIMSGEINGPSTKSIRRVARDHMSNVIPVLLKTKNSDKKIGALMELFSWNFVRLYQSARLYPNSETHGDWLLEKTVALMPGFYYTSLDMKGIITKFDAALGAAKKQQQDEKHNPGYHRSYPGTAQRIGASITLHKTQSIVNKSTNNQAAAGPLNLCNEMETSAVKHLTSAKGITPGARVVLLVPIKDSPAWKTLTRNSRQELQAVVPSYVLHQTGKYEFRSLQGEIYSAISVNSLDLCHVETAQKIHFETDIKFQRVEYQGGGPTFLIAAVDLGTHSGLP